MRKDAIYKLQQPMHNIAP